MLVALLVWTNMDGFVLWVGEKLEIRLNFGSYLSS